MEERKVKVKQNYNSNLHHLPLPLNRKNSMKMQIITTTMRIIALESHLDGLRKGEGDNKIIIRGQYQSNCRQFNPSCGSYNNNYDGN